MNFHIFEYYYIFIKSNILYLYFYDYQQDINLSAQMKRENKQYRKLLKELRASPQKSNMDGKMAISNIW